MKWQERRNWSREETHKLLQGKEAKYWSKLYATSSPTSKKGKQWQGLDLHLKRVNWVLGCLIARPKSHTFTQCKAPELSGFSVRISSKHLVSVILFQTYAEQRISCPTTATTKLKSSIVVCSDQVNRSAIICLHLIWIKFVLMGVPAVRVMNKSAIARGEAVIWGTEAHIKLAVQTAFQSRTATKKPYSLLNNPGIKETSVFKKPWYRLIFLLCIVFKEIFSTITWISSFVFGCLGFFLNFYHWPNYSPTEDVKTPTNFQENH